MREASTGVPLRSASTITWAPPFDRTGVHQHVRALDAAARGRVVSSPSQR